MSPNFLIPDKKNQKNHNNRHKTPLSPYRFVSVLIFFFFFFKVYVFLWRYLDFLFFFFFFLLGEGGVIRNELGMGVRFAYFAFRSKFTISKDLSRHPKGRETRGTVNSKTALADLLPRNVDRHV